MSTIAFAQPPAANKQPAKTPAAAARVTQPALAKPAAPPSVPEVLTNDSVIKMVAAGLDEGVIIAKINSSPANFTLDADGLIGLKNGKVPSAVVRAMLGWKPPATAGPAAPATVGPAASAAVTGNIVKDPGPAMPAHPEPPPPTVPAVPLETVTARQGMKTFALTDKPQSVMFVKTEASTAKEAVVNIVLGDVGIQLLTMGLQPMMGWNPYLGDTLNKAAKVGKGLLLNKNSDTRGFEVETLTGATSDVTLKEGRVELLVPLNRYIPSADMDPASIEPVVLRMQPRDNEARRVLATRKVVVKQTKKNRFDMKPTSDREESDVEQAMVPISVERMAENVIRITTNEELHRGEYALVFRKKDGAGANTSNIALKPAAHPSSAPNESAAAFPGMPPEMMGQLTPEQMQMMQRSQQQQAQQSRGSMFGMGRKPPAPSPAPAAGGTPVAGFLAWDFRILP